MKTLITRIAASALLAFAPALHAADTVEFTADAVDVYETYESHGVAVIRSGRSFPASVRVVIEGGTAKEGEDFILEPKIRETTDASCCSLLPFKFIDDGVPEPDETIVLRLTDPTNGLQLGPRIRTTVTLRNSKTEYRLVSPAYAQPLDPWDRPVTLHEGASNSISILRRGDRDQASTVDVSFRAVDSFPDDGTGARAGVDFELRTVRVGFAAGETNATVPVPIFDNGVVNDRYRYLDLVIAGAETWNLRIEDNERPTHLDVTHDPRSAPLVLLQKNGVPPSWGGAVRFVRLPDGRQFAHGDFTHYNGVARPGLARLLADGELDLSFNPAADGFLGGHRILPLKTGALLAYSGDDSVRLHPDGALDASFAPAVSPEGWHEGSWTTAQQIAEAPDGTLWLGREEMLHQLAADGALLRSNHMGLWVRNLLIQADGRLLFSTSGEGGRPGIRRARSDGTLDPDFTISGRLVAQLPDGRVIIEEEPRVRILTPTGAVDESFPSLSLNGMDNGGADLALHFGDKPFLTSRRWLINGEVSEDVEVGVFGTARTPLRLVDLPGTALHLGASMEVEPTDDEPRTFVARFRRLGSTTAPATVHYTTRDVTTMVSKDYIGQSGTFTFAPLETEKTIQIPILADTEDEFDETLEVVVTAAEGFEALPAPMRLTILGKGPAPRLDRVKRLRDGRVLIGASELGRALDGSFKPLAIEFSPDLRTWHPLTELLDGASSDGTAIWLDASATNAATRYYRAVAR